MKTDDPRLEAGRKEMEERYNNFNALMLAALQGHLIIEQALDDFFEAMLYQPNHLRDTKFSFLHKSQLFRSMSVGQDRDGLWDVLRAANKLRNQIAHNLDAAGAQKKMEALRDALFATLTPKQVEGLKGQPDDYIVQTACVLCAGFLVTLKGDAAARQRTVEEHWKPRN